MPTSLYRHAALAVALAMPVLTAAPLAAHQTKQADAPAAATAATPDFTTMDGVEAFRTFREQRDRVYDQSCRFGVPLLGALNLSRPVLSNRVLAEAVEAAAEEVKTGSGLGYALGRQKVFPRLVVHMIQVGEESGELDAMLLKAADTFDQETANALDRLLAALVPALTVLMTLVVGAVMLSVLLPIYDLTNSI